MRLAVDSLGPHLIPEDGPDDPLFERLDLADTLHVTIVFAAPLEDAQLDRVEQIAIDWFATTRWPESLPQLEDETLTRSCLHLALTHLRAPRAAVKDLLARLTRASIAMHQVILARLGPDKPRSALLSMMDPSAPSQVRYDDEASWWRACFDPSAPPPLSEDAAELVSDDNALIERGWTTFAEHRGLPLHVRDVRICYGNASFTFLETDGRALDVSRAFRAALDARFRGCWRRPALDASGRAFDGPAGMRPAPYNVVQQRDGALDRIERDGRIGYACLFTARELREFLWGNVFRYREHELMLAARDTVRALDLEPVVCWKRYPRCYVLQLWERRRQTVHFAA